MVGRTGLLLGCDSQSPISSIDAVELAKEAAVKLPSPPREHSNVGADIKMWPDEPGLLVSQRREYPSIGEMFPMTFTTVVTLNQADLSQDVGFLVGWQVQDDDEATHSWLLSVTADRQVTFIGERGIPLTAHLEESAP